MDALLNNAAGNHLPTERLSHRAFDAVLNVLHGTVYTTLSWQALIAAGRPGTVFSIAATYAESGSGSLCHPRSLRRGWCPPSRWRASGPSRYKAQRHRAWALPHRGRVEPAHATPEIQSCSRAVPLGRVGEHEELANLAA